jgi:hypothetical protein
MATVGYGHNINYNLRQNTQTDVLVSVWKPDHTFLTQFNSTFPAVECGLTLPHVLGLGLSRQYGGWASGATYGGAMEINGIGMCPDVSANFTPNFNEGYGWYGAISSTISFGIIYHITKYNANTAIISPTSYKTLAAQYGAISYSSVITNANTLLSPLNGAISTDGKLISLRLSATDTNTLGMLQLEVGVFYATSTSGAPTAVCFPFDPVVFCVTADGNPPSGAGQTAILNSIYADTQSILTDTSTLKADTGLLKTGQTNILLDTSTLKVDTNDLKTSSATIIGNQSTADGKLELIRKGVLNGTKIDTSLNRFIIYDDDNTTPVISYDLFDRSGNPASTNVFSRRKRP